ncbi:hypothetical protein M0R45_021677 [Rubus argutus]|uniref:Uncharacterized protein n=1 Tax=Rubus argutus TaxID=59490 RepID=A0AAW1XDD1_RUBAR
MQESKITQIPESKAWSAQNIGAKCTGKVEIKINNGSKVPLPFAKEKSRDISNWNSNGGTSTSPFVMRVFEDEMNSVDSDDEEVHDKKSVVAKRFNFDELYLRKMVYLQAALLESLRLYSPVPSDIKEVVEDDVFPDGNIVKKGARVLYCMCFLIAWSSSLKDGSTKMNGLLVNLKPRLVTTIV